MPNKRYYELYPQDARNDNSITNEAVKNTSTYKVMRSRDFGNTFLLKEAAARTGLIEVLKECFPSKWETILILAMYLCSENEPLYLCSQWAENSVVSESPASQLISELLVSITEDQQMQFYQRWAQFRMEIKYLALDITSISSWSELIKAIEYGYNRDKERLPQVS